MVTPHETLPTERWTLRVRRACWQVDHLHAQVQTLMSHNRALQNKMGELVHLVTTLPPCQDHKHADAPDTA
jgi:hypothetical protein